VEAAPTAPSHPEYDTDLTPKSHSAALQALMDLYERAEKRDQAEGTGGHTAASRDALLAELLRCGHKALATTLGYMTTPDIDRNEFASLGQCYLDQADTRVLNTTTAADRVNATFRDYMTASAEVPPVDDDDAEFSAYMATSHAGRF